MGELRMDHLTSSLTTGFGMIEALGIKSISIYALVILFYNFVKPSVGGCNQFL